MHYENRQPTEGINVTRHSPLLHFLKLMTMAVVCIVLLVFTVNLLGANLAKRVPFRYETAVMDRVKFKFGENKPEELVAYLNDLSRRLAEHLPVPEGMSFNVSYSAEPVFNAYATLGGNLVFYHDLLEKMPNENALAMVVAHEMSHVIHRDPLAGMSGGIVSALSLMLFTGFSGGNFGGYMLNQPGMLTQLTFSREMESAADRAALGAINAYYGHLAGSDTLFRILGNGRDTGSAGDDSGKFAGWLQEFGSTHPLDQSRIASIENLARVHGWSSIGEITALPADYQHWLNVSSGL